jgi:hypothetical protein
VQHAGDAERAQALIGEPPTQPADLAKAFEIAIPFAQGTLGGCACDDPGGPGTARDQTNIGQ